MEIEKRNRKQKHSLLSNLFLYIIFPIIFIVEVYFIVKVINGSKKEIRKLSDNHNSLSKIQNKVYNLQVENFKTKEKLEKFASEKLPKNKKFLDVLKNDNNILQKNKKEIDLSINESMNNLQKLVLLKEQKEKENKKLKNEKSIITQRLLNAKENFNEKINELSNLFDEENENTSLEEEIELKSDLIKSDDRSSKKFLTKWVSLTNSKKLKGFELIYKASENDFSDFTFHEICGKEKIENTLIIIKTENEDIIGGFTYGSWDPSGLFDTDEEAFVFNLNKKLKFDCSIPFQAIYSTVGYGPAFGLADLIVAGRVVKTQNVMDSYEKGNLGIDSINYEIIDYEVFTAVFG